MRIAFNPSTVAALTAPPNNKDITFDLRGRNIFARGVKFCGTDTWRDIKINNVSIDSNILDLQNGSNTTLTNTNGVVTINSTWRPVVDNLTSDSTTSSLSANLGRVLKGLINTLSTNISNLYALRDGSNATGRWRGGLACFDVRDTNYTPYDLNMGLELLFLKNNTNNLKDGGEYNGVFSFRQWASKSDWSGGKAHLLSFTDNGNIWHRTSSGDDSWGSWIKLLDIGNSYVTGGKGVINGTTITQVDNAINANNADTVDGYHISDESRQVYRNYYTVANPAGAWILIKLPAWNANNEIVSIDGYGDNRQAHCVVHCGSRYQGIWGYQSDYNGTVVDRIRWKEVDSGKFAIVALIDGGITYLSIKSTSSLEISKTTEDNAAFEIDASFFSSSGIFHGNVDWDKIIGKPSSFTPSSHSHNYAANENYGGFTKSGRLPISGFYQSYESESGGNAPWSSWMHLINCLHSNTNNNYALLIAASFYDNNTFKIRVTNNNVNNDWRNIIHSGNIGSQTVANAYHLRINSANTWSTWYWSGLGGLPSWLWGSNDGTNMYVWNPSNFNVNTALYLRSLGNLNCQTGRTLNYGDVYSYNTRESNTGAPTSYTSVIGFGRGTAGTVEIAGGWCNTYLYWRSLRDCCEDWFPWRTVLDSSNYTEFINNYYWANVKISASSNTQTQPSVNTIYANNWFRSQGASGWYSESYGGGIYMVDASWIRTFNGKGFYCDNLIYSSSSIRMSNILLEHNDEINNSANGGLHLNYRNSGNISLCNGGGSVGIGTTSPSYKLDVNGLMRASGFHHSSVNSDNYILLAGGGYKSYGGSASNPIFLGYLNLYHGNDGTIDSSFHCLGYSVPFTYTRGGNYCRINIPDTTHQVFYIRAATASVNYSGGGMDTWTGEHRGNGAWWLHCYASGNNDVRVKGFHNSNGDNDSWWGGNPLYSGNGSANVITVCLFGYVDFR